MGPHLSARGQQSGDGWRLTGFGGRHFGVAEALGHGGYEPPDRFDTRPFSAGIAVPVFALFVAGVSVSWDAPAGVFTDPDLAWADVLGLSALAGIAGIAGIGFTVALLLAGRLPGSGHPEG